MNSVLKFHRTFSIHPVYPQIVQVSPVVAKLNVICWCKSHLSPDSTPLRNSELKATSFRWESRQEWILIAIFMYVTAMESMQSFLKN